MLLLYFALLPWVIICKTHTQNHQVDVKLSRKQIQEWLSQYPKSVWWIHNNQLADFCRIPSHKKKHKTSILGRVLPRRANFIEREKGICHRILYAVAYVIV